MWPTTLFLLRISWDAYESDCDGSGGDDADGDDGDNYVTALLLKAYDNAPLCTPLAKNLLNVLIRFSDSELSDYLFQSWQITHCIYYPEVSVILPDVCFCLHYCLT